LRIYFSSSGTVAEVIEEIEGRFGDIPEVQNFLAFLRNPSKQGLMRKRVTKGEGF
jgi:acyl-[acyl carrier protein]--UDP-N-acetylglucosamine O-acyltransferase